MTTALVSSLKRLLNKKAAEPRRRFARQAGLLAAIGVSAQMLGSWNAQAFPPAPDHVIYGLVRDEWGIPLDITGGEVILESGGLPVRGRLTTSLDPGLNYRISVPMDTGGTPDRYRSSALVDQAPFQLRVRIGDTVFVPIEMTGDPANIGQPGQSTHLDLTLGEDSDGDGLPDAWEELLVLMSGGLLSLADINGADDFDGDGKSNLDEFLEGTLAFQADGVPAVTLSLNLAANGTATLGFNGVAQGIYAVEVSDNLEAWTPTEFIVVGGSGGSVTEYQATGAGPVQLQPVGMGGAKRFFRVAAR